MIAFVRQRFFVFSARVNLYCHLLVSCLWLAAFILLSYRLRNVVLSHGCIVSVWQTEMGVMVCQMYKAMYSFSGVSLVVSVGFAALDYSVLRKDKTAGVYRSLGATDVTPKMGLDDSPMIKT